MNENNNRTPIQTTAMESDNSNGQVETEKTKGCDSRVRICVTSYRERKHDTDGVSVKAVLDGLVRRGILKDDSCEEIEGITFKSIKSKEERTLIEIEEIKQ